MMTTVEFEIKSTQRPSTRVSPCCVRKKKRRATTPVAESQPPAVFDPPWLSLSLRSSRRCLTCLRPMRRESRIDAKIVTRPSNKNGQGKCRAAAESTYIRGYNGQKFQVLSCRVIKQCSSQSEFQARPDPDRPFSPCLLACLPTIGQGFSNLLLCLLARKTKPSLTLSTHACPGVRSASGRERRV